MYIDILSPLKIKIIFYFLFFIFISISIIYIFLFISIYFYLFLFISIYVYSYIFIYINNTFIVFLEPKNRRRKIIFVSKYSLKSTEKSHIKMQSHFFQIWPLKAPFLPPK
jgi:uncharacterized membrane-anchored protein YitT (DUF2179 family)